MVKFLFHLLDIVAYTVFDIGRLDNKRSYFGGLYLYSTFNLSRKFQLFGF